MEAETPVLRPGAPGEVSSLEEVCYRFCGQGQLGSRAGYQHDFCHPSVFVDQALKDSQTATERAVKEAGYLKK